MDNKEKKINELQENLQSLRKALGWSANDLAEHIGVTRQTIHNIESGKTPISLTQYLAIRSVMQEEIKNKNNDSQNSKIHSIFSELEKQPGYKNNEFLKDFLPIFMTSIPALLSATLSIIEILKGNKDN